MVEEVDDGSAFSGTWSAGFAGVAAVKFPHKGVCRDICERFPGIVRVGVTFPFDEVSRHSSIGFGVEDGFDFEIISVVLGVQGRKRRWKSMRQNRSRLVRFEERNMEDV